MTTRELRSGEVEDRTVLLPTGRSSTSAPTVVLFLEGANATVLRNVISTLLSAGRNIRVFTRA
jgi:hypothetical protein